MEARRSSYFWEKVRGLFLNYFLKLGNALRSGIGKHPTS